MRFKDMLCGIFLSILRINITGKKDFCSTSLLGMDIFHSFRNYKKKKQKLKSRVIISNLNRNKLHSLNLVYPYVIKFNLWVVTEWINILNQTEDNIYSVSNHYPSIIMKVKEFYVRYCLEVKNDC